MIRYYVRFQRFETPQDVETHPTEWSTWHGAKWQRNEVARRPDVRRTWVERIVNVKTPEGGVVELEKHRWGNVLANKDKRNEPT